MVQDVVSIESLLGLKGGRPPARLWLAAAVEQGLPVSAIDRLANRVAPDDSGFKFRLVPKATLERRRKSASQRLTSEEGDRLARLAKVFAFALEIFKAPEKVRTFLTRPHPMLDERPPLDVALATSPGADLVINLLGRLGSGSAV